MPKLREPLFYTYLRSSKQQNIIIINQLIVNKYETALTYCCYKNKDRMKRYHLYHYRIVKDFTEFIVFTFTSTASNTRLGFTY